MIRFSSLVGCSVKHFLWLLLLALSPVQADTLSVHCPLGCPSNPEGNDLVFTHTYALSNNPNTKFADWVAYEVNVTNFGKSPDRNWASDPLLDDSETLEKNDYNGASKALNIDRGHQAPLASFAGSRWWYELNHLSNITPQRSDLNQGAWKALEAAVRNTVTYRESLYVITGTLYQRAVRALPKADEDHVIPSGYFKVVYDLKGNSAAFVMDQETPKGASFCTKRVKLDDISETVTFKLPELMDSEKVYQRLGC